MTTTTGSFDTARRRSGSPARFWRALRHVAAWPLRVYQARQLLHQLCGLEDHELRDIGLTRGDLRDATALAFDADPSPLLRRKAEGRRRRR